MIILFENTSPSELLHMYSLGYGIENMEDSEFFEIELEFFKVLAKMT